jgi:cysteine-rich repeat protein
MLKIRSARVRSVEREPFSTRVTAAAFGAALALMLPCLSSCGRPIDGGGRPATPDAGADADRADRGIPIEVPQGRCGDGLLSAGEGCDDGNVSNGDGCDAVCQIEKGAVCPQPGSICYFPEICGDGVVEKFETCDDGNTVGGDGCSADCQTVEPGYRCPVPGRFCAPVCGDHLVTGGETCDDGNTADGDGCSGNCLVEPGCDCSSGSCVCAACVGGRADGGAPCDVPRCGDGIVSGDEDCDDGGGDGGAPSGGSVYGVTCTAQCRFAAFCGDGVVNGPEKCDLGSANGAIGGPACTFACTAAPYCGDGILDPGEQCDLGASNGTPGVDCSVNCLFIVG